MRFKFDMSLVFTCPVLSCVVAAVANARKNRMLAYMSQDTDETCALRPFILSPTLMGIAKQRVKDCI